MIRRCAGSDFSSIVRIVNQAGQKYKGVIPGDRWHEPYMPAEELRNEIENGVEFWGIDKNGVLAAVMGLQKKGEVTLIRHAYTDPDFQRQGLGSELLDRLASKASGRLLVGTWAAAVWAVQFYEKHGFRLVTPSEKDILLKKYWSIPARQVETSVVLERRA